MTEQAARQKAGDLTRKEVAEYLRANPDFFVDQDELLRSLTLPHDSGRAISLVERQVHLFREQRDTLRRELVELVSIARHNDRLFEKSKRLLMQVIEARTLNDMASAIDDSIRGDFGLDAASVLLFTEAELPEASQGALHVVSPSVARERLGSLLEGERAVCGQFRESARAFLQSLFAAKAKLQVKSHTARVMARTYYKNILKYSRNISETKQKYSNI